VRQAMSRAGESGETLSGLRLGFALHYYWLTYGYWSLGRELLERLLVHPAAAGRTSTRADALNLAGDLATQQGDLQAAWTFLEESKAIGMELGDSGKPSLGWARMLLGQSLLGHDKARAQEELDQSILLLREAGEPWRLAIAILVRGHLAKIEADLLQARELFSESLKILASIGDTMTASLPIQALGMIFYYRGEYATASIYLQQALEIHRAWEERIFTPEVLGYLGAIELLTGHDEQAARHFEDRLAMVRALTNKADIAAALCELGIALGHLGYYARATALLREGLELSEETGNLYLIAACLTGLAGIEPRPRRAAQMLAASKVTFERNGEVIDPLDRFEQERAENKIREILQAQDFSTSSEEGRAMTVEQAVALALEPAEGI
jgi:tetratricopeptide (TPR) repeat protein